MRLSECRPGNRVVWFQPDRLGGRIVESEIIRVTDKRVTIQCLGEIGRKGRTKVTVLPENLGEAGA